VNADQAKRINLKDYLARLGFEPDYEAKGEYWYFSPFREEKTPSFHIKEDRGKWFWNDFGDGEGGNVIDFALRYYHLASVSEALRHLADRAAPLPLLTPALRPRPARQRAAAPAARLEHSAIELVKVRPIARRALGKYLELRGIPPKIAEHYVQEADYTHNGKVYFGLAFANDSGGYELRNPYFKGSTYPKDITLIHRGGTAQDGPTAIFEGFFDFLTAITIKALPEGTTTSLVMNSSALFERTMKQLVARSGPVYLFLDHDETGRILTGYFQEQLAERQVTDYSGLYAGFKDFNAMLEQQARER